MCVMLLGALRSGRNPGGVSRDAITACEDFFSFFNAIEGVVDLERL